MHHRDEIVGACVGFIFGALVVRKLTLVALARELLGPLRQPLISTKFDDGTRLPALRAVPRLLFM